MNKIRLTNRKYTNFTGVYANVEFKDGVSIYPVAADTANRIAAMIGAVNAETGETALIAGAHFSERMSRTRTIRDAKSKAKEGEAVNVSEGIDRSPKTPKSSDLSDLDWSFTEEQLGKIMDDSGIKGLREFSKPYGVNGKGAEDIIGALIVKRDAQAAEDAQDEG